MPNPTGWVDPLGLSSCPNAGKPSSGLENPEQNVHNNKSEISAPTAGSINWKGFSQGKLQPHYKKHVLDQHEFGKITQAEYLKQAKDFAKQEGKFNEVAIGNIIIKHDVLTGRVFVGHLKIREIRTFYKDDGRDSDALKSAIDFAKGL